MSWVDNLITIAGLGLQAGQIAELQSLRGQQAVNVFGQLHTVARAALIEKVRDELFRLHQCGRQVVQLYESEPKSAATAMNYLRLRLEALDLSTSIFTDIRDKEYLTEVTRFFCENSESMLAQLPGDQEAEAHSLAEDMIWAPKLRYYIDNHSRLLRFRRATAVVNDPKHQKVSGLQYQFSSSSFASGLFFVLIILAAGLIALFWAISISYGDWVMRVIAVMVTILTAVFCFFAYKKRSRQIELVREYNDAKRTLESLGQIDTELLTEVEREMHDSPLNAEARYKATISRVQNYFGRFRETDFLLAEFAK